MGITIVQKSDLNNPKPNPKLALVLSGGGVSGAPFKLGGLQAINNFMLNRSLVEFDIYVGVSSGAVLAMYIANGVPIDEIIKSMEGKNGMIPSIKSSELYHPNYHDFLLNPLYMLMDLVTIFPRNIFRFILLNNLFRKDFRHMLLNVAKNPSYENIESLIKHCLDKIDTPPLSSIPWHYIPNGLFTTAGFEREIRQSLEESNLHNDFVDLYENTGKILYLFAMKLDTAERVVFGYDRINSVPISKAMEASIALPIYYKPVEIDGTYCIDGAVIKTASLDLAVDKGADLIICYNPFRPIDFDEMCQQMDSKRFIADDGIYALLNQILRTLLHTRLMHGIDYYRKNPDFKGDIILIEPTEYEDRFLDLNPLSFWERRKASKRGYQSVKTSFQDNYEILTKIMNAYGITTSWEFAIKASTSIFELPSKINVEPIVESKPDHISEYVYDDLMPISLEHQNIFAQAMQSHVSVLSGKILVQAEDKPFNVEAINLFVKGITKTAEDIVIEEQLLDEQEQFYDDNIDSFLNPPLEDIAA